MLRMSDLLKQYQAAIFEMMHSGKLSEEEFDILSGLSEGMERDEKAVELATKLSLENLTDNDVVDCIKAKQFKTALMIID